MTTDAVRVVASAPETRRTSPELEPPSLRSFLLYFLYLGTFGFGGPIALAGYMQQDLVERRRWISREDYLEGLALAQLAMYLGWVRARNLGATLVAFAFVLPSFVMVMAISVLYVRFGGLSWMQGLFYGIGAAVIAIIARSAVKLARMTLVRDPLLWALFAASAFVTAWTESEIVWVFVLSGVVTVLVRVTSLLPSTGAAGVLAGFPLALASGLSGPADAATLWRIGWFFTEAGAFVFGSGLAIVPFLYGGVVSEFGWLDERQFLDAGPVAMITPGPVVITVAFIGYLVTGLAGAVIAGLGTFLPCYLFTMLPAPYFRQLSKNRAIKAFVDGVTAAASGAIAGAAFVLGRRAITDAPTLVIFLATLLVLGTLKKAPEPVVVLAAGAVGLAVRGFGG